MEFREKYKIDLLAFDSTGSTAEQISKYYDMKGYRRADVVITGKTLVSTGGPSTLIQSFTGRLLCASDCSGGGASGISSATVVAGKLTATGVGTAAKAEEGWIRFSTMSGSVSDFTLTVGTAAFTSGSAAGAMIWAARASDAATVGSEGFIACFNSTSNNTSTALTANWVASQPATTNKNADPVVRISRKNPDGTAQITLGTTGASHISVGMPVVAHLGIDVQHIKDDKRFIAVGLKSTNDSSPISAVLYREYDSPPASRQGIQASKSMNSSTAIN